MATGALQGAGVIPNNVQSIYLDAVNENGAVIATSSTPATAANSWRAMITVPNGTGIRIRAQAYDTGASRLYVGFSSPQDLIGLPVTVTIVLSLDITVTATPTSVARGGVVNLTGLVAQTNPDNAIPVSSILLWTANAGTFGQPGVAGGVNSWTAPATIGSYTITAAIDPISNPDQDSTIVGTTTIQVVNQSPSVSLSSPSVLVLQGGSDNSIFALASDPDNDPYTFSLASGSPAWAAINSATGQITLSPSASVALGTYNVSVVVTDSLGGLGTTAQPLSVEVVYDSDGDGLNDILELTTTNTSRTNPDTDGDGFTDGMEYFNASGDPVSAGITPLNGQALRTGVTAAGDRFGTAFTSYPVSIDTYTAVGMPGHDGNAVDSGGLAIFSSTLASFADVPGTVAGGQLGNNLGSTTLGTVKLAAQQPGTNSVLVYDVTSTGVPVTPLQTFSGSSSQFGAALSAFDQSDFIFLMASDPGLNMVYQLDTGTALFSAGAGGGYGSALAGGYFNTFMQDLAIGSPSASASIGAVEVRNAASSLVTSMAGQSAGGRFGAALASGDINYDSYGDLVVGAPGVDTVYIYYGPFPTAVAPDVITGQTGSQFGAALAVGDINGDLYADIVIGAPLGDVAAGPVDAGIVAIHSGLGLGELKRLNGYRSGQDFGSALYVSNINQDTYADVLVGEPLNDIKGTDAGAAYLFLGP